MSKIRCKCGTIVRTPDPEEGQVYQCPTCDRFFLKCFECGEWSGTFDSKVLSNPSSFYCSTCRSPFTSESDEKNEAQSEKETASSGEVSLFLKYGRCLTELAERGKIEPVIGREKEIEEVTEILIRKNKSNPVLIGEAGVGKTAVVEGLALAISSRNVPKILYGKKIIQIDMASLVAGTKYRGQFEERITKIIKEASTDSEVILFIDEIHTIMGAGDSDGSLDASNILKPALARGDIKCIGATTNDEYQKYIEKDSALERRFQPVRIDELSKEAVKDLLFKTRKENENHYGVHIDNMSIETAVDLSVRYILNRRLPDKAIDVIHRACSKAVMQGVKKVGEPVVREVISDWTGIPISEADSEEKNRLLKMERILKENVIGQDEAVRKITEAVKRMRAGLKDPKRPAGVFLFLGNTGIGKTELAKTLAAFLFGSKDRIARLDMSEFMEEHSISKIIGAPPGYKGYEDSSFADNLKNHPYSIVLLDEIEKAHGRIFDLFLQAFDEGRISDSRGRHIDLKNCIFIMTSNLPANDLRTRFKPEFLNRIDEIIEFSPLNKDAVFRIAEKIINEISTERLKDKCISLEFGNDVIELIYAEGFSSDMGARSLKRSIERLVVNPLSDGLLDGTIKRGRNLLLKAENSKIKFQPAGRYKTGAGTETEIQEIVAEKGTGERRCANSKCGVIVGRTARFCRKCGSKL